MAQANSRRADAIFEVGPADAAAHSLCGYNSELTGGSVPWRRPRLGLAQDLSPPRARISSMYHHEMQQHLTMAYGTQRASAATAAQEMTL